MRTPDIFLISCGKLGEQERLQTSEPPCHDDTVGKTVASNKRLSMGKDFDIRALWRSQAANARAHTNSYTDAGGWLD